MSTRRDAEPDEHHVSRRDADLCVRPSDRPGEIARGLGVEHRAWVRRPPDGHPARHPPCHLNLFDGSGNTFEPGHLWTATSIVRLTVQPPAGRLT